MTSTLEVRTGASTTAPPPAPLPPRTPSPRRWRLPGLDTLYTLVFAVVGLGVGIERLSDNSFFLHLRTGRWILGHGIPHADPFSYVAAGTDWVAQSWLVETLYAALERLAGPFAIRVLVATVAVAVFVVAFRLALHLVGDRVRAALLTVSTLGPVFVLWSERPLVFGVLFLLVVIWLVEIPSSRVGRHEVAVLVVVFWLWANIHGSFALGFAYLGLHVLGRWAQGAAPWRGRERTLVVATGAAFAVCFLNPYGPDLVAFPVELVTRSDALRDVVEWSSPDFHRASGIVFLAWVLVFATVLATTRRRASIRDLIVTLPFLALGFWALRNIAIAPLVALPVLARAVAVPTSLPARRTARRRARIDQAPSRPFVSMVLVALSVLSVTLVARAASEPDFAFSGYPVRAMDAVAADGLLGRRLLADDADGGYVLLRYGLRQPVFLDDRFDMYPQPVLDDFTVVNGGQPGWERVLERRDVEVVVWGRDRVLTQLLRREPGWHEIHHDRLHVVFARDDVAP